MFSLTPLRRGEDSRKNWRTINQVMEAAGAAHRLATDHALVLSALNKLPRDAIGGGWRWATPREYDSDTQSYSPGEVVVVSPGNPDETTGDCVAGLYVCLRTGTWVAGSPPTIHKPTWPPANADPDNSANYWWLIALYPSEIPVCVDGVDVPYYVNAQPVPE